MAKDEQKRKKIIVSGARPSGRLHLGNYIGALQNWRRLQDEYRCYYFIADWHALTTGYADSHQVKENSREMLIDWLSAGLDPERAVLFRQSEIKEHAELFLLLAMITPIAWLERCPTFKEQLRELEGKEIHNYGFLGYPLLQAADILAYRADAVPVGEDQLPHLEIAREVARRFNHLYGKVLPEPEALLGKYPLLPGIDSRKMSKSYENDIALSDPPEKIKEKVSQMITDPQRARRHDPGRPEICTAFRFQEIFNPSELSGIEAACRTAEIGCVQCKELLTRKLVETMAPLHEKRRSLEERPAYLEEILVEGEKQARKKARATLEAVRGAMGL
ncbi:MAG: tryptophan--tRNA ligase [Dethiobacteria bacterium]|mgnify:CR=1 FL=1|jgi:tryptophanyl-tRNA synthetase|nr:tryptophan--tRNA ligase [Bacillota bacterium]HOB28382.1 tryptophan--tRNA ligase [Bacillota bacterium]HPZ41240.1 tryptophan--tRNA ligase [Bacillota bacterium]HQD51931.1 tryptophan--tRNA ligase [Bacillota bacterium]